jgi:ABC-type spermidine/putrescine transport system permease subunit I
MMDGSIEVFPQRVRKFRKEAIGKYSLGQSLLLISPLLLLLIVFYLYPLLNLFPTSLWNKGQFTLDHYHRFFSVPLYGGVLIRTLKMGLLVTTICFFVGYPVAYFLSELRNSMVSALLMACILLPFWTSILVRTYSWVVLFQTNGVINNFLLASGIIKEPMNLLYNEFAVAVGMVNILLPFMVLPVFSVLKNLDKNLSRAAQNLGAGAFQVFTLVIFPLSLPGVGAGVMVVLILSLGFYITPAILGGPRTLMISTLIDQQINRLLNWEFAAALAVLLLLTTIFMVVFFNRIVGLDKVFKE